MSEDNDKPRIKKAECAQCGGMRHCDIEGSYTENEEDEHISWSRHWFILKCRGCDYVFCQTVSTDSESYSYGIYQGVETVEVDERLMYWPALSKRKTPIWMTDFGINAEKTRKLDDVLLELYKALNNDLYVLSAIGLRTAIDLAADILGIEDTGFAQKLVNLEKGGYIDAVVRERIDTLVQSGNASAHRGHVPSRDDLETLMEILEHFLENTFIAPEKMKKLNDRAVEVKKRVPLSEKEKQKKSKKK